MKHKLKKWHIALMSFLTLFIAVFASIFSLRADTVDEETGEILTDNWELSTVFYDSTVDNGTTPLTEINWDASNGGYNSGTPRVITVQINYKNTSAVTTYDVNELKISIPNLMYNASYSAQLSSSITFGANDDTHTGYDWNLYSTGETHIFSNATIIEEKSNFEGSIQIVYKITPQSESNIEQYDSECTHTYAKTLQAILTIPEETQTITSPNWPNNYDNNLKEDTTYWEYYNPEADKIIIKFDSSSETESKYDLIKIYDQSGALIHSLSGYWFYETYNVSGNYVKITMQSNSYGTKKGFSAQISSEKYIRSNEISFNYTRTYIHPWEYRSYTIKKTAEKIKSLDGLGLNANDYFWVKYKFSTSGVFTTRYPNIGTNTLYIEDIFPEECIVKDINMETVLPENDNTYRIHFTVGDGINNSYNYTIDKYLYVAYPKSIYNEENENLLITNTADLYGIYREHPEYTLLDTANVNVNLNEFIFNYNGELYSLTKSYNYTANGGEYDYKYSQFMTNLNYTGQYSGALALDNFVWSASVKAIYTGTPLTIKYGDDLLYITDSNSNYRKLNDNEYYFSGINIPYVKNGNDVKISYDKYTINLYLRYANQNNYSLYKTITEEDKPNQTLYFSKEDKVVGFYFEFLDFNESCIFSTTQGTRIKPTNNIASAGEVHNFNYLQVFFKNNNGELILQNPVDESNYSSFISKSEISTFDQNTYNILMQRKTASHNYLDYTTRAIQENVIFLNKSMTKPVQDSLKELFKGTSTITLCIDGIDDVHHQQDYLKELYFDYNKVKPITNFKMYDLLPEGMELENEDILNSLNPTRNLLFYYFYNIDKEQAFEDKEEFRQFLLSHTNIEIVHNWQNTNRTLIKINIDFPDYPIYFLQPDTYCPCIEFTYQWKISYDAYMQFGQTWTNYVYAEGNHQDLSKLRVSSRSSTHQNVTDNGYYDKQAKDINENGNTSENLAYASYSISFISVVSTYQDVTTYVQTDQSNYSTGTVDSSCNANYNYKLRVRTGSADVTNLIIYTNLEEAQPERQRWKGEFIGIDTTYAESKGYIIKPYYSENPKAGNLYNEDGTLNSEWKLYSNQTLPDLYQNGLEVKFNSQCKTESVNYDWVEIYYILDNITYKLGRWGGSDLAGKIIQIPSNNFYLYWRTDVSSCSYYGFSIDYIRPTHVEEPTATTGSIPSYTITEIQDDSYPDSAFDSYTHGNYGNNVNKIWHYSYTKEFIKMQDAVTATDKTKVKSLAFEYLDLEGNPAILPANSLTYVLINMKSPADESIATLARMDCRTQWNALDEFDRPVDFITGINSNVVKIALPNSIDEDSIASISLKFTKEITSTESQFENMKFNINSTQTFMIRLTSLTANEDGSYNQITALLRSDQELIISQIPIGTYLLEELGDNYFNFIDFTDNNDPEIIINGITFEQTDQGYVITVSEDLTETIEFNIKVTNQIENDRFYEDKYGQENLFLINKEDNGMMGDEPEGQ